MKLLTPEQEMKHKATCQHCGFTYGQHGAVTLLCPGSDGKLTGLTGGKTFEEGLLIEPVPTGEVGRRVVIETRAGVRHNGYVVEIVSAGTLPTTIGLRHIADKRRQPKTRRFDSFVVTTSNPDVTPTRSTLFWPQTESVRFL